MRRTLTLLPCRWAAVLLLMATGCISPKRNAPATAPGESAVTPLRPTSWLICGGFPADVAYDAGQSPIAYDFLSSHAGEADARPEVGETVPVSSGVHRVWFPFFTQQAKVDLRAAMQEHDPEIPTEQVVVYACAIVESEASGEALLGVGSDDGVRVWLNGALVHDHDVRRGCNEDEDMVPVRLRRGENRLLMKIIQGGGGCGFALNVYDRRHIRARVDVDLRRMVYQVPLSGLPCHRASWADLFVDGVRLAHVRMGGAADAPASAQLEFPIPAAGQPPYRTGSVWVDGYPAAHLRFPDLSRQRAETFARAAPVAWPGVFSGKTFPPIGFERPLWVRELIGPYDLNTTFYDRDYNEVTEASRTGRYGAVVDITTEGGERYRRFLTLYRQDGLSDWWRLRFRGTSEFPAALGIDPATVAAHQGAVDLYTSWCLVESFTERNTGAELLAGLAEAQADGAEPSFYNNPFQRDRRWWLGLKRRLYKWDRAFREPFVCPRPLEGAPARIVREGLLKDAGMTADFPERLDAVLSEWSADTDEAFAVCVVRHGVIAFHHAYGMRDGEPMTVLTDSWMASLTKLMSGTLVMMLVDQERLDLDAPVTRYLPALRDRGAGGELTIRHLYTHTDDLDGHWGTEYHDMSERVARLLPQLNVGGQYRYNGTGMELACKALEAVSGETLPDFFVNHLLRPLDCRYTAVDSASWSARSVPLDMAKIGQLLLQKGVYGDKQFFSPDTFEQMLPRDLSYILGNRTSVEYGIGTSLFRDEGLGEGTFAHGAASAATLRIDPENDLVIVMTRERGGRNFGFYHQRFIDTIAECILAE